MDCFFNGRFYLVFILSFAFWGAQVKAETATSLAVSITATWNGTTGKMDLTWSAPGTSGTGPYGAVSWGLTTGSGVAPTTATAYFWNTASSGSTSVTMTPSTGWMQIYAETSYNGGSPATVSQIKWVQAGPMASEFIRFKDTNTKEVSMRIVSKDKNGLTLWDSGEILPGQPYDSGSIDVTGKTPTTYDVFYKGEFADGIWSQTGSGDFPSTPANEIPQPGPTPSPTPPPAITQPLPSPLPPAPQANQNTVSNTNLSIWGQPTAATTDNERLDKLTYKQGIDKLDSTLKKLDNEEDEEAAEEGVEFLVDVEQAILSADAQAKAEANMFTDAMLIADMNGDSFAVPTSPAGPIQYGPVTGLGVGTGSFIIDINPFTNTDVPTWLKALLNFTKAALGWWAVLMTLLETNRRTRECVIATMAIQKPYSGAAANAATAIPVVGAGVSLALHLASYTLTVAVLLTLIPGLSAIRDTLNGLGYDVYFDQVNTILAQGGTLGEIMRMAFQVVPFLTLSLCMGVRIFTGLTLTGGCVTAAVYMRMAKL